MMWPVFFISLLWSCKKEEQQCELAVEIVPGCGIVFENSELRLGDDRQTVEERLGQPDQTLKMGELGTKFSYAGQGLSGFFDETGQVKVIYLSGEFEGSTKGGVQLGSPQSTVEDEFGEAVTDPFVDVWWYRPDGVQVEWTGGTVSLIGIF